MRGTARAAHYHYEMIPILVLLWCADLGGRAEYIGGTLPRLGDRAEGRVMATDPDRLLFLTVGFSDEQGQQQAMVFRVEKGDVRALLASLEARTGLRVQFQDHEARKAAFGSK